MPKKPPKNIYLSVVNISLLPGTEVDPLILTLGGLLVCCVTVIIVLISCMTYCHFKG